VPFLASELTNRVSYSQPWLLHRLAVTFLNMSGEKLNSTFEMVRSYLQSHVFAYSLLDLDYGTPIRNKVW
jgi:hypothetical protein